MEFCKSRAVRTTEDFEGYGVAGREDIIRQREVHVQGKLGISMISSC